MNAAADEEALTKDAAHGPFLLQATRALTRDELTTRVRRAASGFASLGIAAGDAVAILMRNDLPFLEASLAARMLGAYAVPINWHAAPAEVEYILRDCEAHVLVAHIDLHAALPSSAIAHVKTLVVPTPADLVEAYRIVLPEGATRPGTLEWHSWIAAQPVWTKDPALAADSMLYTSGTTGTPKGVRRFAPTLEQTKHIDLTRRNVYGIKPGARTVVPGPLYHGAPNGIAIRAAQIADMVVLMGKFDPEELLRLIETHRIDTIFMVPTMFVRLLKLDDAVKQRYDLSSLRFVLHAAAPCPIDIKRRMIEWWGPVIHEFYGGTESGPVAFSTSSDWLTHPGSVGRVLDEATVKVIDDEGRECLPGEPGEVFVRLRHYPDFTYHGLDDKRREIERDGLISLGDVGYVTEDRFLFLCDRKRDMVIIGGANVYPAEIEAAILDMAGVQDCAVFGVPDAEYGESLLALVEPHPGASITPTDVRSFLQGKVSGFKLPRAIQIEQCLLREDSGKIRKRQLRDAYWKESGRRI